MPGTYKAECLVLAKTKLGETDAVITMLDAQGHQIRAVAKGVRKPGSRFGARLEPYSHVNVLLHAGRNLDVVGEARNIATNEQCRCDLEHSAACALVAEFCSKVTREADAEPRFFAMTAAVFGQIGELQGEVAPLLAAAHLVKAFAMLGVGPALESCALCGKELQAPARFDIAAGGALCSQCAPGAGGPEERDKALASWVSGLLRSTFAQIGGLGNAPTRELLDFCESWALAHLSVKMRSAAFLKALC